MRLICCAYCILVTICRTHQLTETKFFAGLSFQHLPIPFCYYEMLTVNKTELVFFTTAIRLKIEVFFSNYSCSMKLVYFSKND